jgi:hypothetical protein
VWKEGVALEDRVHVPAVRRQVGDVAAVDLHASLVGADEAADDAHRGRLATSARAENREKLAPSYLERHVVDGGRGAVPLRHAVEEDLALGERTVWPRRDRQRWEPLCHQTPMSPLFVAPTG